MKNIIIIDIDTEREIPVYLNKPQSVAKPTNEDETKKMVLDDLATTCEALLVLIKLADTNKFETKEALVNSSIKYLQSLLVEPPLSGE